MEREKIVGALLNIINMIEDNDEQTYTDCNIVDDLENILNQM